MKVPCKQCIVYAICKQRRDIKCFKLYRYITEQGRLRSFPTKELPKLIKISRDSLPYLPILKAGI